MKKGDMYLVTIDEVVETERGPVGRVRGFNTLFLDQYACDQLIKLEEGPELPTDPHGVLKSHNIE